MGRFYRKRSSKTSKNSEHIKLIQETAIQKQSNPCEKSVYVRNSKHEGERLKLLDEKLGPSKERWVALGLFCALSCSQCCVWNTWGPIANFAMLAFPSWQKSLVALLSNWGCITYVVFCLPCCWFLQKSGLSLPLRTAAILSALATFVRCISTQEIIFSITAHVAAVLNGLSGVIIGPATLLLSATWFSSGERTTATGISSACNQLGMAISYLAGPAIVGIPYVDNVNISDIATNTVIKSTVRENHLVYPKDRMSTNSFSVQVVLRIQIISLMRIEFVAQSLVLVSVLLFFPKQQSHVILTQLPYFGLGESILSLLRNKNMWLLCLSTALSQGVTGPWLAMITITFGPTITQNEVDKLAFWTIICSSILSITASRLMDIFQGPLKVAIYILLIISSLMFLWVLLLIKQILEFHKSELYAAVILGISSSWSTPALFLELASEIAFPVSEAIVGGYMILMANLIGTLFYFSYFLPQMSNCWSSYLVFANVTLAAILTMYVKIDSNRTNIESDMDYAMHSPLRQTVRTS